MKQAFLSMILVSLLLGITFQGKSQKVSDSSNKIKDCQQEDVFDLIFTKKKILEFPTKRKLRFIAIPVISYSPTTGIQFGAGASVSWPWGSDPSTRLSAGIIQAVWTTERQVMIQLKNNIYTDRNKWFIQTDWRLYFFRLATYGLSTGCGDTPYPMLFNWIKFHNVVSREVVSDLYIGLGYHLDYHYDIRDESLDTTDNNQVITPHYSYSIDHGFDPGQYLSSGISANVVYDSRDNIISPYKGFYVNLNYRYDLTWLGSQKTGLRLWAEFRTYIGISKVAPRHLVAFWLFGNFKVAGDSPYLVLMSSGFDQMNSSGRGY